MNRLFITASVIAAMLTPLTAHAQLVRGLSNTIRQSAGQEWSKQDLVLDSKLESSFVGEVTEDFLNIKLEAFGPTAEANLDLDKYGYVTGDASASNDPTNPDPTVIFVRTEGTSVSTITENLTENLTGNIKSGSRGYYNEFFIDANSYLK